MEAVQTTAATAKDPTTVCAESTLTWTQMEGTALADQGSHRIMLHSLVTVSMWSVLYIFEYVWVLLCFGIVKYSKWKVHFCMGTSLL